MHFLLHLGNTRPLAKWVSVCTGATVLVLTFFTDHETAVAQKGTPRLWIPGEVLDTMHDAAWFAFAMLNALHATGDPFY